MQSRKNHEKATKTPKETSTKIASKSQTSKASPRRKFQTRTDDIKNVQSTLHRNQSPSPSRGSSRASSSPVSSTSYISDACTSLSKVEDPTTATSTSISSSPVNAGPSSYRAQWVLSRKLSGRSRFNELQGKSKVAVRVADDGKIYIKRSSEERNLDPDRLLLDRCNLTHCPIIEGEEFLHLLNLQQNQIPVIENLDVFSNLKFLDLSDNLIEHISGLDSLSSLRMLIIARNRLGSIDGLQNLQHLDVLDLSGNEIKEICNINHLCELRMLNLSSNQITHITGMRGLKSLVELNISKNFITEVSEVDVLPRLQRLFLSQNSIERFEDMYCVSNIPLLCDLTLEGCPLTAFPNYRHLILYNIPQLKVLDSRRALDEERRTAHSLMRKEEQKRQEGIRLAKVKEAKVKAIATARQLWETSCKEPSSQTPQETSTVSSIASAVPLHLLASRYSRSFSEEEEDMFCSCCGGQGIDCSECDSGKTRIISNGIMQKSKKPKSRSQKRSQDMKNKKIRPSLSLDLEIADSKLTYLAEVEFGNLQLYGPGAVAATISHAWAPQTVSLIHTVSFHFVVFDDIVYLLGKLKTQFPNIEAASFECACLESLAQLNALGQIPGLKNLTIETEGNPILQLSLWRMYAVYRLSPTIEQINGSMVTELERNKAEDVFGGLGFAASLLLPKYRLSSLLNSPRVKQMFLKEKGYSPNSLQRQPDSQVAIEVMKATFTYNPDFEFSLPGCKTTATKIIEKNIDCVQEIMKKRLVFQRLWPSMFLGIVNDALEDYIDLNRHMKLSMQSLLKKCKSLEENLD
ncbi:leucine-rich repeat-containing protein 49-like isoform X2 [Argiope bruennichi]|uniref:leucine-rich repeat-containing protein 49-like isoform X2 n=1 Tax=Argiope bruennichi TaxID=94029 RepID=UPI002493FECC|nr:leucine-rich repeat-containing protein 49-like isoform X2 [Argiope bruennichi]XP_055939080.1 leucine-rich repeat-containing protein 49-like isoform X2 [Argiope bruennichi]